MTDDELREKPAMIYTWRGQSIESLEAEDLRKALIEACEVMESQRRSIDRMAEFMVETYR